MEVLAQNTETEGLVNSVIIETQCKWTVERSWGWWRFEILQGTATVFGNKPYSFWLVALWEKLSCQDVLRRGSPLRQEVGQSSTALWITAVLQPEVPSLSLSVPPFFSLGCFFSFFFFGLSWTSITLCVPPSPPPPRPRWATSPQLSFLFTAVWSFPLPSPFLWSERSTSLDPRCRSRHCHDYSSECAPRGKCSDPVSADGVLQEPRHLLTVLLCI